MKKTSGLLRQFGFSHLAENIYFDLLNKGSRSVSDLAQGLKQHRPAIYKALPELLEAKLITKHRQGRRYAYDAASPVVLTAWIKKRIADVELILPIVSDLYERRRLGLQVSSYEGKSGVQTALDDLVSAIPKNGQLFCIEAPKDHTQIRRFYTPYYKKRTNRASGDIDRFIVTNQKAHKQRKSALNVFSKSLETQHEHNFVQFIGTDRVTFIDSKHEQAFVVTSQDFAKYQADLFKALCKKL